MQSLRMWTEVAKEKNQLNLFVAFPSGVIWFTADPGKYGVESAIRTTESLINTLDQSRAVATNYLYALKNPKVEVADAN